jgi:hypothetical protein
MDYENPLDHLIHRFQHRWETNAQFRAAMSGVLGLGLIIFLCIGVAGVNAGATRVLAAVGFGAAGGNQVNIDPGGQIVNGNWTFYTPTVPNWNGGATPGSNPIPNSQTPAASPTPTATPQDAPTATPCRSNCGGGGGVTITGACVPAPCHWFRGQPATLTFHTSKPNNPINMFIHWSNGADWLSAGGQYGSPQATDGNGDATWTFAVPTNPANMCGSAPNVKVDYSTRSGGGAAYGPSLSVPCA